eukprot:GCRY01002614.1.p1 GENE.GCRY01002614.1~~GCRY01002614.1.p1  ORF type:complete len:606 (+),score=139.67 GCRY01002614.1:48-1820(+)
MNWKIVCLLLVSFAALSLAAENGFAMRVNRKINLNSQVAAHELDFAVKNLGKAPATTILFLLEKKYLPFLSSLQVVSKEGVDLEVNLKKVENNHNVYEITFDTPVDSEATKHFAVSFEFINSMTPLPKEINQDEPQSVVYELNEHVYSPYKIRKCTTEIELASNVLHNVENDMDQDGKKVTLGPYKDVAPFSSKTRSLHFQNNSPFLVEEETVKDIELSHWAANIAVEESHQMKHVGAKVKSFSRLDYQRQGYMSTGNPSVAFLNRRFPVEINDMYYRDTIGNISTSFLRRELDSHLLQARPRFPLFGGWQTEFTLGYNLPMTKYVTLSPTDSSLHTLTFPLDALFDDTVSKKLVVRVTLPEGASFVDFKTDKAKAVILPQETRATYLDTYGRTVFVFEIEAVTAQFLRGQSFALSYHFTTISLLQEPLLLFGFFLFLFLSSMAFVRFTLRIRRPGDNDDLVERIKDCMFKLDAIASEKNNIFDAFDNDTSPNGRSVFDGQMKDVFAKLEALEKILGALANTAALEIVQRFANELLTMTKLKKDMHQLIRLNAENKVSGKKWENEYLRLHGQMIECGAAMEEALVQAATF